MINDILDLSQISEGKLNLSPETFCLVDLVKDVSKLIKFQAKRKGLSFEIQNYLQEKGLILFSDPNRLKQVLLNLLSNALKFTQQGSIVVSLNRSNTDEISQEEHPDSPVIIKVEDTGCGIKDDDIPKLFKLFGMIKNKESEEVNKTGVGLGLAISQNLVKILNRHKPGAEITVKSQYRKGSVFSFPIYAFSQTSVENNYKNLDTEDPILTTEDAINFVERDSPPKQVVRASHSSPSFLIMKPQTIYMKRILLVDDDQINILVLTQFFKDFDDCEYNTAYNGAEALEIVKKNSIQNIYFDLIFMDCNMPIMDGFEATKRILDLVSSKEIPPLYIIASSANASLHDREMCLQSGMVDFLSKPFTKKALREKIDKFSKN